MSSLCLGVTIRSSRTDTTPILQVSAGPKRVWHFGSCLQSEQTFKFRPKIIHYATKNRSKRAAVGEYLRII
jgi:hypothetical protein